MKIKYTIKLYYIIRWLSGLKYVKRNKKLKFYYVAITGKLRSRHFAKHCEIFVRLAVVRRGLGVQRPRPGGRASPESGRIIALSFVESYCRTMRQVIDRHRTVERCATIFRKLHARPKKTMAEGSVMRRGTRARTVRLHAETRVRISLYSGRVRPRTRMQSSWITVVNFLRGAIKAASFAADGEKSII